MKRKYYFGKMKFTLNFDLEMVLNILGAALVFTVAIPNKDYIAGIIGVALAGLRISIKN